MLVQIYLSHIRIRKIDYGEWNRRLNVKNGLTPKDIHRIKKFSRRSGNSIQVEITNLGNGLFRLLLVFLLLILTLCSAIYLSSDNNHTRLIISFLIAVSIICFFLRQLLKKSFLEVFS